LALLSSRWTLADVDDVEALVFTVARRAGLGQDEDAISALFEVVWRAWQQWEPSRASFSTFCFQACRHGAVDYRRKRDGRTVWRFGDGRVHERKLPELIPLDRLDEPLATRAGDPAADRSPDLERLLAARGSTRTRDLEALGLDAA
jgi:DNA-directed RNA polymerase specialized sigma24 family protein